MRSPLTSLVVVAFGLCLPVSVAKPQESGVAERLFREGKRLMSENKIAEACKAFDGSYAKDPVVSTLLNLADCREKNQQYATAWSHFLDAERLARGKPDQASFAPIARK